MKKKLSVLLICTVALVSILLTPTLIANARRGFQRASGEWKYVSLGAETRVGDGYTFILGDESGVWTGTFTGTSYDVFQAVVLPSGKAYISYALIFFEGNVGDKQGTLVISFAPGTGDFVTFSGRWKILSGTGELENLHGQGIWSGPSYDMKYSGLIYFEDR